MLFLKRKTKGKIKMKKCKILLLFLIMIGIVSPSQAQWKPRGSVDFIVGWPPGGNVDRTARILEQGFEARGVNINVKNVPGAGSAIAVNQVIKSKGDGQVVLVNSTSFLFNHLMKKPGTEYNVHKDLKHLLLAGAVQHHLYAKSGITESLEEIIANEKSGKKQYTWAVGSAAQEFAARLIEQKIGKPLKIVVYKGSTPMSADLLGGHVDLAIDAGSSVLFSYTKDKKVNLVATFDPKDQSNGAVTVDQYLPGVTLQAWFGLSLPKSTPKHIVSFYQNTMADVLKDPEISGKLTKMGLTLLQGEDLGKIVKRDHKQFSPVAKILQAKKSK